MAKEPYILVMFRGGGGADPLSPSGSPLGLCDIVKYYNVPSGLQ